MVAAWLDLEAQATVFDDDVVVALGPRGAFDESGATASCAVDHEGRLFQYYTGWSLGVTVPFYLAIGCAVSEDGLTFTKISRAPILGRTEVDPFLTASPSVMVEDGSWRMWYVSGTEWDLAQATPRHRYHIKYAESADGVSWQPTGHVCIDYRDADETAIGRPCVVRDAEIYRMWFCSRGDAYRIGYAESADGLIWERKDAEIDLRPTSDGWDSEMQAYPYVFDHRGARHMLYNGNGYGATGIGHATLDGGS